VKRVGSVRALEPDAQSSLWLLGRALPRLAQAIEVELKGAGPEAAAELCLDAFAIRRDLHYGATEQDWKALTAYGDRLATACIPKLQAVPRPARLKAILAATPDLGHSWNVSCLSKLATHYGWALDARTREAIGGQDAEARAHYKKLSGVARVYAKTTMTLVARHMIDDCAAVSLALSEAQPGARYAKLATVEPCSDHPLQLAMSLAAGHMHAECYIFERDLKEQPEAFFALHGRLKQELGLY